MAKIVCTIKRSTWARGGQNGWARLLNPDGNMCCLGFLGEACGIAKDKLLMIAYPFQLSDENYLKYPKLQANTWGEFSYINDNGLVKSQSDREERLQTLAEANGFTFVFVD